MVFENDLAGEVGAGEGGVIGHGPLGGVFGTLGGVGGAVCCDEVCRVVGEGDALFLAPLVCTRAPGFVQGYDVVDLHLIAGALASGEVDGGAGVGVVEGAGGDAAAVIDGDVGEVSGQNVVFLTN